VREGGGGEALNYDAAIYPRGMMYPHVSATHVCVRVRTRGGRDEGGAGALTDHVANGLRDMMYSHTSATRLRSKRVCVPAIACIIVMSLYDTRDAPVSACIYSQKRLIHPQKRPMYPQNRHLHRVHHRLVAVRHA